MDGPPKLSKEELKEARRKRKLRKQEKFKKKKQYKPGQCRFWNEKKKRYCRIQVCRNSEFCVNHIPKENDSRLKECPHCKALINEERWIKHTTTLCPTKLAKDELESQPYFSENINAGSDSEPEGYTPFFELTFEDLQALINKIDDIHENLSSLSTHQKENKGVRDIFLHKAEAQQRHRVQIESIATHLKDYGLVENSNLLVEMGAGKGALGFYVSQVYKKPLLAVDISCQRRKMKSSTRITMDIKNLNLGKVKECQGSKACILSKHLCGAATDFTLRCCRTSGDIVGGMIALCCRHRLTWKSYVGKEYIRGLGISEAEFKYMSKMTSWVNSMSDEHGEHQDTDVASDTNALQIDTNRMAASKLTAHQKIQVGRKCIRILDEGRVDFLRKSSFDVDMMNFVTTDFTPENKLLTFSKEKLNR